MAAARLGAAVTFVGSVGADDFAEEALQGLREARVRTVLREGGPTGVALIIVDARGENQIVVAPGANSELREPQVGGAVLAQLEIPVDAVEAAARGAERFFLNAAPARSLPAELVRAAELVVVNRYELEALPETPRLTALTLGEEGAVLLEGGSEVARAERTSRARPWTEPPPAMPSLRVWSSRGSKAGSGGRRCAGPAPPERSRPHVPVRSPHSRPRTKSMRCSAHDHADPARLRPRS